MCIAVFSVVLIVLFTKRNKLFIVYFRIDSSSWLIIETRRVFCSDHSLPVRPYSIYNIQYICYIRIDRIYRRLFYINIFFFSNPLKQLFNISFLYKSVRNPSYIPATMLQLSLIQVVIIHTAITIQYCSCHQFAPPVLSAGVVDHSVRCPAILNVRYKRKTRFPSQFRLYLHW